MKKVCGNSPGQTMVLFALSITCLLGMVALGTDVGVMYMNWQHAQKTADAAAIAGANELSGLTFGGTINSNCTGQPDEATEVACTYAVENGFTASNLTLTEPTSSSLKVVVSQTGMPYFFAKALGMSTYSVGATAVAQAPGNIGTVTQGLFPVGLQCTNPCNLSNLDPGQSVSFGSKFVGGLAPGNWQWLSLGGTGASTLGANIQNGATGSYTIGGTINSSPGNKGNSGPVSSGLSARLNSCPSISDPCTSGGGNPTDIPANDPCEVVVPAVDFAGCTGNCTMTIEGFAIVYIEPATTTSTSINGCFVTAVTPNTISSSTAPGLGGLVVDALTQ